jgi:hypothetical protein
MRIRKTSRRVLSRNYQVPWSSERFIGHFGRPKGSIKAAANRCRMTIQEFLVLRELVLHQWASR